LPVTVIEAIKRGAEFLEKKGIDSPRLQVELLLAHALRLPRMGLYLNFERVLTEAETDLMRERIQRRAQRTPLQYILGSTSFCGLELVVNPSVLVPRPETEELAELGWQFLQAAPAPASALDFGTGSGCLAIALAVHCPAARVLAVDISPEALAVARQNATQHQVLDRIEFLQGNSFATVPPGTRVNLIIANPPYIPAADLAGLQPEVRDFEPRLALVGGEDGLEFFRLLAREAWAFLRPGGRMMLEFGEGQAPALAEILRQENWIADAARRDYSGRERILVGRRCD
jgi:release factor glutamine methyltransferase